MIRRHRTSSRPSARFALLQVACAAAALAGCGGGGAPDAAGTGTVPTAKVQAVLQTYITDNLATDYSKVWVSIRKITAVDAAGAEVTLLDATAAPVVVNHSSLASVGQFLSTVSIPAGVYGEVRVTLDNSVQLVSLDGATTISAKLTATGTEFVVHVRNLDLDTAANGQLVLDFNLARFTYDPATGLVTPTIEAPKPSDAFGKFVRQQAEVHGTVKSVDTVAQTLVIDDARLGSGIVVSLATDAVILDAYQLLAAREGVFCEAASAASVAGLLQAHAEGRIPQGSRIVCTLTGNGLKDPDTALARAPVPTKLAAEYDALARAIS